MTLVCVRLDNSYGIPRIVALADSRASLPRGDGSWKALSDTTVKLFAVPVRCYRADCLEPVIGSWSNPYCESQIGIGFSGSCFEAMTIIAHLSRMLAALVAVDGNEPMPEGEGIVNLVAKATEVYFGKHSLESKPKVQFLVFGCDQGRPWIGQVSCNEKRELSPMFEYATGSTLKCIGDSPLSEQRCSDLIEKIRKHREGLPRPNAGNNDGGLEADRHVIAERKVAEDEVLQRIEDGFVTGIGGTLQRLELWCWGDNNVSVGYTQDDRDYLDHANFSVSRGALLGPVPIVEKMGRQARAKKGLP